MSMFPLLTCAAFAFAVTGEAHDDIAICGANALWVCLDELGVRLDRDEIIRELPDNGHNSSLSELAAQASARGVESRGLVWSENMPAGAPPAILPVVLPNGRHHFVAVRQSRGWQVLVQDGATRRWLTTHDLRRAKWDGTALHIATDAESLDRLLPSWWKSERLHYFIAAAVLSAAAVVLWRRQAAPDPQRREPSSATFAVVPRGVSASQ